MKIRMAVVTVGVVAAVLGFAAPAAADPDNPCSARLHLQHAADRPRSGSRHRPHTGPRARQRRDPSPDARCWRRCGGPPAGRYLPERLHLADVGR